MINLRNVLHTFVVFLLGAPLLSSAETSSLPERDLVGSVGGSESPELSGADGWQLAPTMEGDEEFGEQWIIERGSNWDPWNFRAESSFVYTTNTALAATDEEEGFLFHNTLGVSYSPTIRGSLFANVGLSRDFYQYNKGADLDFDYTRVYAGIFYQVRGSGGTLEAILGDSTLALNYIYHDFGGYGFGGSLFTEQMLNLAFQRIHHTTTGQFIYYGLSTEFSLTASEELPRRHSHSVYAGYRVEWTPELSTQFSWTGSYFDYLSGPRTDYNHVYGLSVDWILFQRKIRGARWQGHLSFNTSYILNDSDEAISDYENWNIGILLGFKVVL